MKCESVREQLIDLWRDALEPEARAALERHLAECEACESERAELGQLWGRLAALDDDHAPPVPSAALRSRFYRSLGEYERQLARPPAWRRWLDRLGGSGTPALQPAWSIPTLILGVALGASIMWAVGARNEVQRLSAEVDSMRRAVSLSLLEHPSASERLRGVSWSSQASTDERIVEALLDSVRNDPNVNVRLVALEALARQVDSPRVRAGLIETLPNQESPMLQVALVEILNQQNGNAADAIQELLDREDLDESVRERIQSLLQSV